MSSLTRSWDVEHWCWSYLLFRMRIRTCGNAGGWKRCFVYSQNPWSWDVYKDLCWKKPHWTDITAWSHSVDLFLVSGSGAYPGNTACEPGMRFWSDRVSEQGRPRIIRNTGDFFFFSVFIWNWKSRRTETRLWNIRTNQHFQYSNQPHTDSQNSS